MGLESLIVARDSLAAQKVLSIPRERNLELLGEVEQALAHDEDLRRLFDRLASRLHAGEIREAAVNPGQMPVWFGALYQGPLDGQALRALGL